MPDTDLQTSETRVVSSETKVISTDTDVTLNEPIVILSEAKALSPAAPTDDTLELDLALEEELIIEDFTIDGICGVY